MNIQILTTILLVVLTIGLIIYDIFARVKGGWQGTISYVIFSAAFRYPLLPFAFGVLMGHFFFSQTCVN